MPLRDAALLLLGHGSTLNADSSAPTYQHAEEIARRGVFAEVHVAFWKEEPNFRQALRQTHRRQVYVVPNFISSGYFTEQIIPRELGLSGPITHLGAQEIFYCKPVGLHPSMMEALMRRANDVVHASGESPVLNRTCLFICGHGTSFNDNSTKIIYEQAAAIRAQGIYGDCQAVLMEQKPFVKDWRILTSCPDVIVVPFFIADGLHSYEDIPVLLGLTHNIKEQGFTNPHRENGRRLWYATAIGSEAFTADVILSQASQFEADYAGQISSKPLPQNDALHDEFAKFLRDTSPPWKIGELIIRPMEKGGFALLHREDLARDPAQLRPVARPEDLRELVRLDRNGNFRPLRAAPNLRNGWIHRSPDQRGLQRALDYLYPSALANWALQQHGQLIVAPWSETAERQSGRFRIVREVDAATLSELVASHCQAGCLKRRLWPPQIQAMEAGPGEIPLLCPEACNFLVGQAREKVKGPGQED